MDNSRPSEPDRTRGPSKWTAVVVLGVFAVVALLWAGGPRSAVRATPSGVMAAAAPTDLRVDVNTASRTALEQLPGIGPSLAERIVADREAHGPFHSLAELDRVPGIGPKTIQKLTPMARAGADR